MTLTHHRAVDLVRERRSGTPLDAAGDRPSALADPSSTPDEPVQRDVERAEVYAAVTKLNAGEQQVIGMAYFDGYSQNDIAEHLGIPFSTVRSRTLSGTRHLRRQLRDRQRPRSAAACRHH